MKDTGIWECQDFFPVSIISKLGLDTSVISPSVKQVLKVSLDDTKHEYYTIDFTLIAIKTGEYCGLGLMSPVTLDRKKGWSGVQAIPREIWLDKSRPSQADVEVTFDLPKLEKAEIFDPSWVNQELLCSEKEASKRGSVGPFGDHSRSSLVEQDLDKTTYGAFLNVNPVHDKLSLRTLIDHSIVESFRGEEKTCITSRVYPKLAIGDRAQLHVFNNGTESIRITSLSAWSMKKATRCWADFGVVFDWGIWIVGFRCCFGEGCLNRRLLLLRFRCLLRLVADFIRECLASFANEIAAFVAVILEEGLGLL
ncbi:hypothetical protein GIB67_037832 [Kingdonia uniflora]|uniref:Glycosyl hydrolase family 32 C-terminal domain-containing protein n=1 Tax=Kingdonia uniflora TaxID=39325 RepID=A0A7J7LBE6_9MAGN|nr:hypothetical protein GIB67_037832 [Kingdonia uniflora]